LRLIGFDNAHTVRPRGSQFKAKPEAADHWRRAASDEGRPYEFTDAATLIDDFMNEVARVLTERGIPLNGVADENERRQ
jgi:hypothetical protein